MSNSETILTLEKLKSSLNNAAIDTDAAISVLAEADRVGATSNLLSVATGNVIDPFMFQISIFVLAIIVGYFVVWSVTPALHTPLMSVTNAISSVIIVGAILAVGVDPLISSSSNLAQGFGAFGLMLAAVNIVGGFMVTRRMLAMYKKKERTT